MKKGTDFYIGNTKYTIAFDIRSLASMERSLGRSIFSIFVGTAKTLVEDLSIDVIAAAVKYGVDGLDDDPYDFLQMYFDEGGDYNTISGIVAKAFVDSGLFTKGKAEKPKAEPAKAKP